MMQVQQHSTTQYSIPYTRGLRLFQSLEYKYSTCECKIYFTGSSEDSCRDDLKGNGNCDPVNNNAKCNYDYGDCCEEKRVGDGICDARNNFITCNTDPNNKDAGRYDGGDCRPRKCFADKNDPLDSEY